MQQENINRKIDKLQIFIKSFLNQASAKNKKVSIWHKDIKDKLSVFATTGKSMRGLLVLLAANSEDSNSIKVASALELIHSSLLIQDDIMDQDEKRRGADSIHIQYAKEFKNPNIHYGISQAISLSDISIFLAFELLNSINHVNKEKIIAFFMEEIIRVGFGQMQDVFVGWDKKDPSLDTILDIYKSKTARYSISLPVALGYLLSKDKFNEKVFKQIILAGEHLGIAFQLKDDELGIWGQSASTGKGILKDVNKNKKTAIKFLLLEKLTNTEKKYLNSIFGKENLSESDINGLLTLLEKYKVKDAQALLAKKLNQKAGSIIKTLPKNYQEVLLFIQMFNDNRVK